MFAQAGDKITTAKHVPPSITREGLIRPPTPIWKLLF